jgi:hypothetical protein
MARTCTLALVGAILISLPGCAGGAAEGVAAEGVATARRDPDVITREELAQQSMVSLSAYDAIQRLRPNWLNPRGATSIVAAGSRLPAVLINNTRQNAESLRTLAVSDVESLRFVEARDATTRFGTGYVNGLIEVVPRVGGR